MEAEDPELDGHVTRDTKRIRGCLIAGGALLGILALALLLVRDRPRRMVEATLTDRIGVPVRISRLTPLGLTHWRLEGMVLAMPPPWPWIDTVSIERLEVEGKVPDMLAGHFRTIVAHGVAIRARYSVRPSAPPAPSNLTIERLVIQESSLSTVARGGQTATPIAFGGELFAIGSAAHGKVNFDAPSFEPHPWLRLGGWIPAGYPGEDFRASCSPEPAQADLVVETPEPGALAVEIHATLPWTEKARLAMRREASRTTELSLVFDGVDPLCWLPPIEGLAYTGTLDIAVDRSATSMPTSLRVEGTLADLTWQTESRKTDLRSDALRLSLETSIPSVEHEADEAPAVPSQASVANAEPADGDTPGAISARATLVGLRGRLAGQPLSAGTPQPDTIEAHLDGLVSTEAELSVGGNWTVKLGTLGTLRAEGAIWRKPRWKRLSASFAWSLDEIAAEPVIAWLGEYLPGFALDAQAIRAHGRLDDWLDRPTVRATVAIDQPTATPAASTWQLGTDRLVAQLKLLPADDQRDIEIEESVWRIEKQGVVERVDAAPSSAPESSNVSFPLAGRYQRFGHAGARATGRPARELLTADLGRLGSFHGTRALDAPWTVTIRDAALSAWVDLARAGTARTAPTADQPLSLTGTLGGRLEIASPFDANVADANVAGTTLSQATRPGALHPPQSEPARLRGVITLTDGGFASADGARAAEGLTASAAVHLAHLPSSEGQHLRLSGNLHGPVVLWDTLFADFGALPVDFEAGLKVASTAPGDPLPWQLTANLTPGVDAGGLRLELETRGSASRATDFAVRVRADDLRAAYDVLVRQPFAGSSPRIDGLRLGGRGDARLTVTQHPAGQRIEGELTLEGANLATPGDTLVIERLGLDLPFDWIRNATAATRDPAAPTMTPPTMAPAAQPGRLAFGRLNVAGVGFANVDTPLSVEGDSVRLAKPLTTAVAGGTVAFQDLAFRRLLSVERELATAISLHTLDLGRLTQALDLPQLAGRLDGEIPLVRLRATRFEVDGAASLQLFGGTVRLFDIAGRDFFSPFPRVTFSADIGDLDLAQLTAAFAFGRMAGRIDGTLRQCTLVGAQPVACAAKIESRDRARTPRWIDVEAVNNLSVLGTGGGLQQGLARRFLRRFTYDKLGVSVQLADDRFLLRGLVHKRGREFFLKGRLPFPIDIVNAEPGSSVSFESMLDRLRNLEHVRWTRGRSQSEDQP